MKSIGKIGEILTVTLKKKNPQVELRDGTVGSVSRVHEDPGSDTQDTQRHVKARSGGTICKPLLNCPPLKDRAGRISDVCCPVSPADMVSSWLREQPYLKKWVKSDREDTQC